MSKFENDYDSDSSFGMHDAREDTDITPEFTDVEKKDKFETAESEVLVKDFALAASAKEQGNIHFRNKDFYSALDEYSRAVALCPRDSPEDREGLAVFLGNRSAAFVALDELELAIEDCSAALELSPRYVKVLVRRSQCYEKQEKYDEELAGNPACVQITHS
jgi:tetratricopeptide (TPR) repeat protein